jgi:hypothetical protein
MVLTDNLISYYKLDETSGTNVVDSVGTTNMTSSGITVNQDGKIDKSYLSDSDTDSVTTSSATSITGNFSINLWAYRTGTATYTNNTIVEQGSYASNTGFGFYINQSHQLAWRVNQNYNNYKAAATLTLNTWEMYTLVYNGSTIKIYKNGSEASSESFTTNPTGSNLRRMFNRETNSEAYIGRLDEVGIWSRALTSDEVSDLYNSGSGLTYPFIPYYSLTVNSVGLGTGNIVLNPSGGSYEEDTEVTITASVNDEDNRFYRYYGDIAETFDNPITVTMTEDLVINCQFQARTKISDGVIF